MPAEPDGPQTKDERLERIRAGRTAFDAVLRAVPPEAAKDLVA